MSMSYQQLMPMIMQMLQQQGGGQQPGSGMQSGQNYFNPQGGSGAYSSQKGLMGGSMGDAMGGGMAGDIGGIASGLFNMFGAQDPSAAANPYLSGIEGGMNKYLSPYMDAGKSAMGTLMGQYGGLVNDPGAMMNKIGAGFQQSPGFQFQTQQAGDAANRASAAGGMLGSPMQQQNIASTVNGLAQQDYGNYMNRGMSMYNQGLSGLSHVGDMGLQGAGMMSQGLLQQLLAQAQNAYAGAANSNQSMGGGIGSLASGIAGLAGF